MSTVAQAANLEEVDDESPSALGEEAKTAASTYATSNPPSASVSSPPSGPVSSLGEENGNGSTNNGDASSQEWEHLDREAEVRTEEVVAATDDHLNQVGEAALQEAEQTPSADPTPTAG